MAGLQSDPVFDEKCPSERLKIRTDMGTCDTNESSEANTAVEQDNTASAVPSFEKAALAIRKFCHMRSVQLSDEESRPSSGQTEPVASEDPFLPSPRPRLEDRPLGYPRLAALQSSDEAFSIYRRFDYLHARVLLDMQYEISKLEQKLWEVDDEDNQDEYGEQRLASRADEDQNFRDEDPNACKRRKIMGQLRDLLLKYDGLVIKAREMVALQKPNRRDYTSVITWFNNWKPLVKPEWYSLQQQDDMVTLRQGREWAMFDGWVETMLRKCDRWCPFVEWIFRPESLRELTKDADVHYYHPRRVEGLVAIVITAIIFVLLVIPVVLMYNLTSLGNRNSTLDAIGVMVVFTLLFSAAMSLLTKAKRHELFGASAAYCAVLVVFITNFNGPSSGST